jgi:hypothetical protein
MAAVLKIWRDDGDPASFVARNVMIDFCAQTFSAMKINSSSKINLI